MKFRNFLIASEISLDEERESSEKDLDFFVLDSSSFYSSFYDI